MGGIAFAENMLCRGGAALLFIEEERYAEDYKHYLSLLQPGL